MSEAAKLSSVVSWSGGLKVISFQNIYFVLLCDL